MKKHDADDGHDGGATRKNCRNGGKRTTFLEQQEERDRARADADTGQQRIIKTSSSEFLIPSSRKPEDRQVDQDRQCRASFDHKTSQPFANVIGSKTGKDLMRAIKHSSDDRVPEPSRHRVKNVHYKLNQTRDVVLLRHLPLAGVPGSIRDTRLPKTTY
jgi:hypothetical protein